MKFSTQGQRFQGFSTVRVGVRRAALATLLVAGGVGVYAVTLASGASSPRPLAVAPSPAPIPSVSRAVSASLATHSVVSPNVRSSRPVTPAKRTATVHAPLAPRVSRPVATTGRRATITPTAHGAPVRVTTTPAPAHPSAPAPASVTAGTSSTSAPTISAAAAALAANLNPAVNIAPSPNFLQSGQCTQSGSTWSCQNPCVTSTLTWPSVSNDPACTEYVLGAINVARQAEGLVPMALPSNWYSLTTPEQLFVVANLERTARGLPPYLGINLALSAQAQQAATSYADPSIATGFPIAIDPQGYPAMGGAWSSGFSVLAADYIWMYDDGWGGSVNATFNIVCTSANAAGCWAHRDELLGYDPGFNPGVGLDCANAEMGVGFAVVNGSGSFVDLIEQPKGTAPAMTFTWAANVVPYL